MTKQALLTVEDVKNFIFQAIMEQGTPDGILTRTQMKNYFGISEYNLDTYLEMGLPWFGKQHRKMFNIYAVKKWFVKNNIPFEENNEFIPTYKRK